MRKEALLPAQYRLQAGCCLDLVMPFIRMDGSSMILHEITDEALSDAVMKHMTADVPVPEETASFEKDAGGTGSRPEKMEEQLKILSERERFATTLEERPPIPVTVSVSELKHPMYEEEMRQQAVPLSGEEGGASRGSAYHTLMEYLNYSDPDIPGQLESLVKCGKIDQFDADRIAVEDIKAFTEDPIGNRMRRAFGNNALHRETPFVIGRMARDLKEEWDSDEIVLVQGIIDAWFEENEKIVLLDYKTDRVARDTDPEGATLVRRYGLQLSIYADALRRMTGKEVSEVLIYSFALRKCIPVEMI